MKKLILSLVFVLVTGASFMNANSANDEFMPVSEKTIETVEEFGCASDCVKWARDGVLEIAADIGEDPNSQDFYMEIFMKDYKGCLKGC